MDQVLEACRAARGKPVVVLTGAGVSAESGIPTLRGKEGYWTIGSRAYHPQELATRRAAEPNPAHRARAVQQAREHGATIVDVNPDADPFSELADHWVQATAANAIPKIVDALL